MVPFTGTSDLRIALFVFCVDPWSRVLYRVYFVPFHFFLFCVFFFFVVYNWVFPILIGVVHPGDQVKSCIIVFVSSVNPLIFLIFY